MISSRHRALAVLAMGAVLCSCSSTPNQPSSKGLLPTHTDACLSFLHDRPLLGADVVPMSDTAVSAEVGYIQPGSPASGVLARGDIVTAVEGDTPSVANPPVGSPLVVGEIALHHPGEKIDLEIERNGIISMVSVVLVQWTVVAKDRLCRANTGSLGVTVSERNSGVIIEAVRSSRNELPVGARLVSINDVAIHSVSDVWAALSGLTPGDTTVVSYVNPGGQPSSRSVRLGAPSADQPRAWAT
jgi:S1-C subfamily serine protease